MNIKSNRKFIALAIALSILVINWTIRLLVIPNISDPKTIESLDMLVSILGMLAVPLFIVGIIVFVIVKDKETPDEPKPELSPREEVGKIKQELERNVYTAKNNLGFNIFYCIMTAITALLGVFMLVYRSPSKILATSLIFVSIMLMIWFLSSIKQNFDRLRKCKSMKEQSFVIKEIQIPEFEEGSMPVIRIMDDGLSYLIFDVFPPNNNKLSEYEIENLDVVLSDLSGVPVIHDDRELFIIESDDENVINKIADFLKSK